MVKEAVGVMLAMVWLVLGVVTPGLAAQNVANASQKGSLLIFPRIDTTSRFDPQTNTVINRDTLIRISNDYPRDTRLRCHWMDANQTVDGFEFVVTNAQPVWFRASDGMGAGAYEGDATIDNPIQVTPFYPNRVGELKCWAINAAGTDQIAWNHLYGTAMVIDYAAHTAYEYNSLNFTVRPSGYSLGDSVPPAGDLKLSAQAREYDACPAYLIFNFFSYDTTGTRQIGLGGPDGESAAVAMGRTQLTLVPCHQDLRQDRVPTCTKAKFDLWNENEVKFTGAYQCMKCWFEGYLQDLGTAEGPLGGAGGAKFTLQGLHTTVGRLRVQGVASTVCRGAFTTTGTGGTTSDSCWTDSSDTKLRGQRATPLLGLMITDAVFDGGHGFLSNTGIGAGTGASVDILWDPAEPYEETSGR